MRFLCACAALLIASGASALPFTGTLTLDFNETIQATLTGEGEGVSTPSTVRLTSGGILGSVVVPITSPNPTPPPSVIFPVFPIVEFRAEGPAGIGPATFSAGGGIHGGFGGNAPLTGAARAGLFGPPPFAFLTVPMSVVGMAGGFAETESILGIEVSVFGHAWTTGAVVVTANPGPTQTLIVTARGSDERTPGGVGRIQLVSPALVVTNIAGSENITLVTTLDLEFFPEPSAAVPEPGALVLFGAGAALVAARTRRRARGTRAWLRIGFAASWRRTPTHPGSGS